MQEYRKNTNIPHQRNPKAEVFDTIPLTNRLWSNGPNQNIKSIPLKLCIKNIICPNSPIIYRSQKRIPSPDNTSNRFPIALGRVQTHSSAVREIESGYAHRPITIILKNSEKQRLPNKKGVSRPVKIRSTLYYNLQYQNRGIRISHFLFN